MFDVPQGSLSRAKAAVNAYTVPFGVRCMVLTVYLAYFVCIDSAAAIADDATVRRVFI